MSSRSPHASALLTGLALVTGLVLVTAACGPQTPGTSAGGVASSGGATPAVSRSASPAVTGGPSPAGAASPGPAAAASANPTAAGTCDGSAQPVPPGSTLTLSSRDNGATYCLRVGQQVLVYLQGSPAHMWAPIRSDSSALRPGPNGSLMLMRGVTGAAFVAARPGTAHLSSARPVCTERPVRCDALIAFHVTTVIAAAAR